MKLILHLLIAFLVFAGINGQYEKTFNCNVTERVTMNKTNWIIFDLETDSVVIEDVISYDEHFEVMFGVSEEGKTPIVNFLNFCEKYDSTSQATADLLILLRTALNIKESECPISGQSGKFNRQFTTTVRWSRSLKKNVDVQFALSRRVGEKFARITLRCTVEAQ